VASTLTPNAAARSLSVALKRPITAKAVRTMARNTIKRFDKTLHPEYQGHVYSAAEVASLRKAFSARTGRAVVQPTRKAASKARTARKATSAPKVTDPS
jgi:hypothetical protein